MFSKALFGLRNFFVEPLAQMVEKGGWVIVEIGVVSLLTWLVVLFVWRRLQGRTRGGWADIDDAIKNLRRGAPVRLEPTDPNVIRTILRNTPLDRSMDRRSFEACVAPALNAERLYFQQLLRIVAGMASVMPLLGLLGTVLGMIQTFSALTETGAADPEALARGISTALIATELGLVLALIVVVVHAILGNRLHHYIDAAQVRLKQVEAALDRTA